jgi:acetylornithine/N-succinyldiaminopimelate aminotransferase
MDRVTKQDTHHVIVSEHEYVLQTYKRPELVLVGGEGARVFDSEGRTYLDGVGGIAVNALGYRDPQVVAAIQAAADGLIHVSNLYHTAPHALLARSLVKRSFADRVFFCNSGAEAVEGALKFARKYARHTVQREVSAGKKTKSHIVAFNGSFHGRTMGALSTTATEKYRAPYEPLIPGVYFVPFNNSGAAEQAITDEVCAVIVEPVQGEGGVHPAAHDFLQRVRTACDRANALLIFDEVQCGLGRTGHLWAHEAYEVEPDIMTLAKPLAGGLPMGAVLMTQAVADVMGLGDHGSTFAAGPLVCQVAQVVLDRVSDADFLAAVREKGQHLGRRLSQLADASPVVRKVRGTGLMFGIECALEAASVIEAGYRQRILVCSAGPNVVRLLPPLTITHAELDDLVDRLAAAFEDASRSEQEA